MIDMDKVMEALDCLAHGGGIYDCLRFPCPYGFYGYTDCHKWEIARDALELLKEKETKDIGHTRVFQCEKCGYGIDDIFLLDEMKYKIIPKYCPNCGRVVKKNDAGRFADA